MWFQTPEAGLGLGLMLGTVVALAVFAYMRRENNAWRRRVRDLAAENGRLRADNARLNGHPALRASDALAKHTASMLAMVEGASTVVPFQRKAVD